MSLSTRALKSESVTVACLQHKHHYEYETCGVPIGRNDTPLANQNAELAPPSQAHAGMNTKREGCLCESRFELKYCLQSHQLGESAWEPASSKWGTRMS